MIKNTPLKNTKKNTLFIKNLPSFVEGFALQSYAIAENGITEASQNNYQYWYIDTSLGSDSFKNWDSSRIANLIKEIEHNKVSPIVHGNFKAPISSDIDELRAAAIQYTKNEINLASKLNAPLIIHGGAIVEPRLVKKVKKIALNNLLSSLDILVNYAKTKNVDLYLENLSNYVNFIPFHYIFTHDEEFDFILSSIDIKFFLDLGHANIGNNNPTKIFEKYHKHIVGMSFSNNDGKYDQHLSLHKGTINYREILASIELLKWKGIVAFETRDISPQKSINELLGIYQSYNANFENRILC